MQIPQEHRKFQKPTLLVVSDNMHAKLYKGEERQLEKIGEVDQDYYPYADANRNMRPHTSSNQAQQRADAGQGVNSYTSEKSENIKQSARKHLYKNLNKELMHRLQDGEFEQLIITAPENDVKELKSNLHNKLTKRIKVVVPKTLTKMSEMEIIKHVEEAIFPAE
jgi:protein required for attachment to host cells